MNIDSHYYALTYVLSNNSDNGTTNYTHHNDMVALHYALLYAVSNLSEKQMTCNKHHMKMDALHHEFVDDGNSPQP